MPSPFITFEGGEGVGKTTQIHLLADFLTKQNIDFIISREPGGSRIAEKIRNLLLYESPNLDGIEQALIINAARRNHWRKTLMPAAHAGKWVLCDRFYDSTLAYQGYAYNVDLGLLQKLHDISVENFTPDLSFILDMSPEKAIERVILRDKKNNFFQGNLALGIPSKKTIKRVILCDNKSNFFDKKPILLHQKIREAFLAIAKESPKRIVVINAEQEEKKIQHDIQQKLKPLLDHC